MWTLKNRPRYDRDKLRYPSDLTDEEWSLVEPLIPPAKRGGRKRDQPRGAIGLERHVQCHVLGDLTERAILVDPLAQSFRRSGVERTWRHDISSRGLAPV